MYCTYRYLFLRTYTTVTIRHSILAQDPPCDRQPRPATLTLENVVVLNGGYVRMA